MAYDLVVNGSYNATGKFGSSLVGDASIPDNQDLYGGRGNLTVEGWVKNTAGGLQCAFGAPANPWVGIHGDGRPRLTTENDHVLSGPTSIIDGAWHHLAFCLSPSTSTATFFVDGVLVATDTNVTGFFGGKVFGIGSLPGNGLQWVGETDNVAVTTGIKYTSNFTPSKVTNSAPNLVAVWQLDGDGLNTAGVVDLAATALLYSAPNSTALIVNQISGQFSYTANGSITGSKTVTPSDGGDGGTFMPTSATITDTARTATFQYTAASVGNKTISVTNTAGASNPAPFTFVVSVVKLALAGTGGYVSTAVNVAVSANGAVPNGATATLSDGGAGGTFSPSATVAIPGSVQYQPSAIGTKTITTTNTGSLTNADPLMLVFTQTPVAKTAHPTPSSPGIRVVTIGSGVGQDFADPDAFRPYLAGQALKTNGEILIAETYQDFVLSGTFGPPVMEQDENHYCIIRPVPGYSESDAQPTGVYDFGVDGVKLTVSGNAKINRGVLIPGFRVEVVGSGALEFGGPFNTGLGAAEGVCGAPKSRFLLNTSAANAIGYGEYNVRPDLTDCLFIRAGGSSKVFGGTAANLSRSTFINRSSSTAPILNTQGANALVKDVAFGGCGPTPYENPSALTENCYTDTGLAVPIAGLTVSTSPPLFIDRLSDVRPNINGALYGNGSLSAKSTADNRNKNRGLSPDVGSVQLNPGSPLPGLAIATRTNIGQFYSVTATTSNAPTEVKCSLIPNPAFSSNLAIAQGPLPMTLGANSASISFAQAVPPGKYLVQLTGSNAGGPATPAVGFPFEINGISGAPEASDTGYVPPDENPSSVTGVTVTPAFANLAGGGALQLSAHVDGLNNPSQAVTWSKVSGVGTLSASGLYTAPAATVESQVAVLRATSSQDGSKSGASTITVPSLASSITAVAISPASLTLAANASQQFTATVTGTGVFSQAVTWSKSGPGTLSGSGLFVAPPASTIAQVTTITATSVQDGTKVASVVATVVGLTFTPTVASVVVAPATAVVSGGASRQFSASVIGTNNPSQFVTWSKAGGGTLGADGLFTAPAGGGSIQTITITATSITDGTKSGNAVVTVPALVLAGVAPRVPASRILVIGAEETRFDPSTQNANTAYYPRGRLPCIDKDPDARLGYGIELGPWLAELNTTLTVASATYKGVTIDNDGQVFLTGTQVLFWVKGGILPLSTNEVIENSITVHFTGDDGSEDERTILFAIADR